MPKPKLITPERATGLVALSYLVLIPIGAAVAWRKIHEMDKDVDTMWEHLGLDPKEAADVLAFRKMQSRIVQD